MSTFGTQDTERIKKPMNDKQITRLEPGDRRKQLLGKALALVAADGFSNLTRDGLAAFAGVSSGLINKYFDDMDNLREQIMLEAIDSANVEVIAKGISIEHPLAQAAPDGLKRAAVKILLG